MDDEELPVGDDEIREAFECLEQGTADFSDIMLLVNASSEREEEVVPKAVTDAVFAKFSTDADFANGGADQFVWNRGSDIARQFGMAWRNVGACENGDLLVRLADAYDTYRERMGAGTTSTAQRFLEFRKLVKGPYFGIPEPGEELAEALLEWCIEHLAEFCGYSGNTRRPDELLN